MRNENLEMSIINHLVSIGNSDIEPNFFQDENIKLIYASYVDLSKNYNVKLTLDTIFIHCKKLNMNIEKPTFDKILKNKDLIIEEEYVKKVFNDSYKEFKTKEHLINIEKCYTKDNIDYTLLDAIIGKYQDLKEDSESINYKSVFDIDTYVDQKNDENKEEILSTGWSNLDELLGGGIIKPGIAVLLGIAGQGKSEYLCNIAFNYYHNNHTVVYFTLEMGEKEITNRLFHIISGQPYSTYDTKSIEEYNQFIKKYHKNKIVNKGVFSEKTEIKFGNIIICDFSSTICMYQDMDSQLSKIKKEYNDISLIIVDNMTNIVVDQKKTELYDKGAKQISSLRKLSNRYNASVITGHQMNRDAYKPGVYPRAHMIGESMAIQHGANVVLAIYQNSTMKANSFTSLNCLKMREIHTGYTDSNYVLFKYESNTRRIKEIRNNNDNSFVFNFDDEEENEYKKQNGKTTDSLFG